MAVNFINCLKHTKGEWFGKNFELIDWQPQIIRDVFETMKPNSYRQFNTAYIEIARKQEKSELAAAFVLFLICSDFKSWGEIFQYPKIANTILDRILHHAPVVDIVSDSYRLKKYFQKNDRPEVQPSI